MFNRGGEFVNKKKDGKDIVFPVMFNHNFNEDGKTRALGSGIKQNFSNQLQINPQEIEGFLFN